MSIFQSPVDSPVSNSLFLGVGKTTWAGAIRALLNSNSAGPENPFVTQQEIGSIIGTKPVSFFYFISDGSSVGVSLGGPSCDCAYCSGTENPPCKGCANNGSAFYKCRTASTTISSGSTGVYTVGIDLTAYPNAKTALRVGNLVDGTNNVSLTKTNDASYTITVKTNAAGTNIGGKLDGALLEVIIFP